MLGDLFEKSLVINASRTAIEHNGEPLTYRDLDRWSGAVADDLVGAGIRRGDRVAILTGNCAEFIVCDIAIARLAAVKLPINDALPAETVSYILAHSGAAALIVGRPAADLAAKVLAMHDRPIDIWATTDCPFLGIGARRLPRCPDGDRPRSATYPSPCADDPAALYYTGGTTGRPKGALHSQASLVAFHDAQLLEAEIRQQDRLLLMTPLAHAAGLFAQSAVLRGATIVLRPKFDASEALHWINDLAITWTFLVPTMIYRLLDVARQAEQSTVGIDTIVYGAAPISPARLQEALALFGSVFVQLYGQTECPNWGTRLVKTDHDPTRRHLLASCGQASIRVDVRIVGDDGRELPNGEAGEIELRAPYVLARYFADEEATRAKFNGEWMRTGDIGVLDEQGYLYLKDRRADMVISGGMNVYCREVEDALLRHPQIRNAAVIGIPDDDWGEAVHAVVVRTDSTLGAAQLLEWTRDKLARYARPKSIEFVDALPETPFGKIDKKVLREPYWQKLTRDVN